MDICHLHVSLAPGLPRPASHPILAPGVDFSSHQCECGQTVPTCCNRLHLYSLVSARPAGMPAHRHLHTGGRKCMKSPDIQRQSALCAVVAVPSRHLAVLSGGCHCHHRHLETHQQSSEATQRAGRVTGVLNTARHTSHDVHMRKLPGIQQVSSDCYRCTSSTLGSWKCNRADASTFGWGLNTLVVAARYPIA